MKIQSAVMCCLLAAVLLTCRTEGLEKKERNLIITRRAADKAGSASINAVDNEPDAAGWGGRGFSTAFSKKKSSDAMDNEPVGWGGRGFSSTYWKKTFLRRRLFTQGHGSATWGGQSFGNSLRRKRADEMEGEPVGLEENTFSTSYWKPNSLDEMENEPVGWGGHIFK